MILVERLDIRLTCGEIGGLFAFVGELREVFLCGRFGYQCAFSSLVERLVERALRHRIWRVHLQKSHRLPICHS